MKSRPNKRSGTPSQSQLEQQAKFSTMIRFIQPFLGYVNLGFKNFSDKMSGFNSAMGYNLKSAISGTYPGYEVNYQSVLVARVDLPNASNPQAVSTLAGQVEYTWSDNTGVGKAKFTDKAMLLVYCPELKQAIYTTGSANRNLSADTLDVTEFIGKSVETYLSFIS